MDKGDVPRLRHFLGILMRATYGDMPGKDMVQLVGDMNWLAREADKLDNGGMKVLSTSPISTPPKRVKKK